MIENTASKSPVGRPEIPRTKTRRLLGRCYSASIKKTLLFHHVLVDQIKSKYKSTKKKKQKQIFSKLLCGRIVTKYRLR